MSRDDNHQAEQSKLPMDPGPCPVPTTQQTPLTVSPTGVVTFGTTLSTIKVPVVLAESTLQIVVESNITLATPATEIKRVKKNVFLNQVKLVPVAFAPIPTTDFFTVTSAKLFVSGHIRKNIEYAGTECAGELLDQVVDIPFSGFVELESPHGGFRHDFISLPIITISENAEANFLNELTQMDSRLDKFFFQNLVKFNEQPFGELVAANFFELDFSPTMATPEGTFSMLTEKIVLDLTVKVLQLQQLQITASPVVPDLPGLTPPPPVGVTVTLASDRFSVAPEGCLTESNTATLTGQVLVNGSAPPVGTPVTFTLNDNINAEVAPTATFNQMGNFTATFTATAHNRVLGAIMVTANALGKASNTVSIEIGGCPGDGGGTA